MIERLAIPEVFLHTPQRYSDHRGRFSETFNQAKFEPFTGPLDWVQDNESVSTKAGTLRGLHFQAPPHAQDKLVRCVRGRIIDVAVDLRRGSPTFGGHVRAELSANMGEQIFVPKGFAHAFLTLEPETVVAYKVSAYYNQEAERAIAWNDPDLRIDWGKSDLSPILSKKDMSASSFARTPVYFE